MLMTAVTIPLAIVTVPALVLVVMVTFAPVPLPPPAMLANAPVAGIKQNNKSIQVLATEPVIGRLTDTIFSIAGPNGSRDLQKNVGFQKGQREKSGLSVIANQQSWLSYHTMGRSQNQKIDRPIHILDFSVRESKHRQPEIGRSLAGQQRSCACGQNPLPVLNDLRTVRFNLLTVTLRAKAPHPH
jgi:hypothetical protein